MIAFNGFGNPVFNVYDSGGAFIETITFPVGMRRDNTHDNRELLGGEPVKHPFTLRITERVKGYRFNQVWDLHTGTWPSTIEDFVYHESGANQSSYAKAARLRNLYEAGYTIRCYPYSEMQTNYGGSWSGIEVGIRTINRNSSQTDRDRSFEVNVYALDLLQTPDFSHLTFTYSTPATPTLNGPIYDNTTSISGTGTAGYALTVYNSTDAAIIATATVAAGGTWTATITAQTIGDVLYCYQTRNGVNGANSNNVTVDDHTGVDWKSDDFSDQDFNA